MTTETRSSANKLAILPMWVIDRIKEEMRLGPAAWQAITDAVEQAETPQALPCEVKLPPGTVIGQGSPLSTLLMAIAQRGRQPAHAQVFSKEPPAPQPHPEPIAWMVGTAIWWTKEEADRDTAATGLPMIPVGPLRSSAEVDQLREVIKHSDAQIMRQSMRISNQHAQVAERDALLRDIASGYWELAIELPADILARLKALSVSAEPSAPGNQGLPIRAVRAPEIQDLLDRAATAIGQYGDSLLGRGKREDSVDLLDLEREVRDLEQEFKGAFGQPCTQENICTPKL